MTAGVGFVGTEDGVMVFKYNPHHDKAGLFATGGGAGAGSGKGKATAGKGAPSAKAPGIKSMKFDADKLANHDGGAFIAPDGKVVAYTSGKNIGPGGKTTGHQELAKELGHKGPTEALKAGAIHYRGNGKGRMEIACWTKDSAQIRRMADVVDAGMAKGMAITIEHGRGNMRMFFSGDYEGAARFARVGKEQEGPIMRLWDAVKQAFGGAARPSATEALALASVSRDTVEALTDEELRRLERLCHDAIAEAVAPEGREEEGLPIFVVSERGIGMNPGLQPDGWGFRLMVTPEGIKARTGGE